MTLGKEDVKLYLFTESFVGVQIIKSLQKQYKVGELKGDIWLKHMASLPPWREYITTNLGDNPSDWSIGTKNWLTIIATPEITRLAEKLNLPYHEEQLRGHILYPQVPLMIDKKIRIYKHKGKKYLPNGDYIRVDGLEPKEISTIFREYYNSHRVKPSRKPRSSKELDKETTTKIKLYLATEKEINMRYDKGEKYSLYDIYLDEAEWMAVYQSSGTKSSKTYDKLLDTCVDDILKAHEAIIKRYELPYPGQLKDFANFISQ